jgi:DNA replication and repair protein RecF
LGANGQGKTSVLEALALLSNLRSFRGSKSQEMIRWESPYSEIQASIRPEAQANWKTQLKISLERVEGTNRAIKTAFINDKPYSSSAQYLSQRFGQFELGFHSIVFNPSDHDLVRGEPAGRRAYLDRAIAAEDLSHLETLSRYQRVLEQRNAILKDSDRSLPRRDLLQEFTNALLDTGSKVIHARLTWLLQLSRRVPEIVGQIAPTQLPVRFRYQAKWFKKNEDLSSSSEAENWVHFAGHDPIPSLQEIEHFLRKKLAELEIAEWKAMTTLVGPHRDDWGFLLGSQPLKGQGSQGEVRSCLLSLKLAEIELFQNRTGHRPILLLDDFSSELDRQRRMFLMRFLEETDLQVFVTTTEDFDFPGRRFWVENGQLVDSVAST